MNSQTNKDIDPATKKIAVVVGITLLALVMAVVVSLVYKLITCILGL